MRAESASQVTTNAPLAALLAVEAYNIDSSSLGAGAMQRVLTGVDGRQATLADADAAYFGGALSIDGNVVAAGGETGVDVWDVDARSLLLELDAPFPSYDLSADGTVLAVSAVGSERLDLVDVGSGDVVGTIDGFVCGVVRLSPSGNRLATVVGTDAGATVRCDNSAVPGQLQIWDISAPSSPQLEHVNTVDEVFDVWWSPDGTGYLTFVSAARVAYHDATTHEPDWTYAFDLSDGGQGAFPAGGALFRSDGGSFTIGVVFGERAGSRLFSFDTATGELIGNPTSTAGLLSMNWWNEEENQVVATLGPSAATVLDLERAAEVVPSPFENRNATGVWVDRARDRIVAVGLLGVEVFSLDGRSVLERRVGLTDEQLAVQDASGGQVFGALSSDGDRLLMSLENPSLPIIEWDLTTDPATRNRELPPGFAYDQGDSTGLITLEGVQVLDGSHDPIGPVVGYEPDGPDAPSRGPIFIWKSSSDGSTHAPLRFGSSVIDVYDTETGERIDVDSPANGDAVFQSSHSFSDDGAYMLASVVTADGERWAVYDTETGAVVHSGRIRDQVDPDSRGPHDLLERPERLRRRASRRRDPRGRRAAAGGPHVCHQHDLGRPRFRSDRDAIDQRQRSRLGP